jgi:hypothetical protein
VLLCLPLNATEVAVLNAAEALTKIVSIIQTHCQVIQAVTRWAAYLNIWAAFGVASGSLDVFAHRGPFAWDGLLAWWLLVVTFFIWFATMAVLMHNASRRLENDGMAETWIITTIEHRQTQPASVHR